MPPMQFLSADAFDLRAVAPLQLVGAPKAPGGGNGGPRVCV